MDERTVDIDSKALAEAVKLLGCRNEYIIRHAIGCYLTASGLSSRLVALEDENKMLREAAGPFIEFANDMDADRDIPDDCGIYAFKAGDFRRLRNAALSGAGAEKVDDDPPENWFNHRSALASSSAGQEAKDVEPIAWTGNWNGWRSIDTAPEDQHVILGTSGGHVGEAIMLIDEDTGQQKWAWALGPLHPNHTPYGWQPLPSSLSAPVLSDLRDGGFDGPTGAE